MEDIYDTLAADTAADALAEILPLVPFELEVSDLLSLMEALTSTIKGYHERGTDPGLEHDYAVVATQRLVERLPLMPPDDVREKMIGVCARMLADFRRDLCRRWWSFQPRLN